MLNLYIVCELNNWSINPNDNITLKNCLFGTVKLIRYADNNNFI